MYIKKILASLTLVSVMAVSAAMFAAYEAHVINVTAHIENALRVNTEPIMFGTVFPQEYVEETFTIDLSESFMGAERVDDVEYVIKQKMKPCPVTEDSAGVITPVDPTCVPDTVGDTPPHNATGYHYMSLCPFLSKTNDDDDGRETENDTSHPSYFNDPTPADPISGDESCTQPVRYTSSDLNYSQTGWAGWSCPAGTYAVGGGVIENDYPMGAEGIAEPGATIGGSTYPIFPHYTFSAGETGYVAQNGGTSQTAKIYVDCLATNPDATGRLTKISSDISDLWTVDLKVPPVDGSVGQDWPEGCPTVAENDKTYGCDLWIEVTGISEVPRLE